MQKKYLIVIGLVVLIISITLLLLNSNGWHKSCGGITGETGRNKCNEVFKCVYDDNFPDSSGSCKIKFINI